MPRFNPRPTAYLMHTYGVRNNPMFIHPWAFVRGDSDRGVCQTQQNATSIAEESMHDHTPSPALTANAAMIAEMKISLAAKQLAEQVKENKEFWGEFRDNFEKEVASIKPYIDENIVRQIWQKKIEHNNKPSGREIECDGKFTLQNVKLEACLNQIDEAIKVITAVRSSHDHSTDHDTRYHHLEKIRATGGLVLGLTKKSTTGEAVCKDLLAELSDLERLLDPQSPVVRRLHRFDMDEDRQAVEIQDEQPGRKNSSKSEDWVENAEPATNVQGDSSSNWNI